MGNRYVLAVERRLKILERVAEDQSIEVGALARDFDVSEMTIRRDLRRLERDGFVRRTYGGAATHLVRAVEAVRRYNTDVAVIGAGGVSARRGITELDDREAEVIRAALSETERIVVLADGSKVGSVGMCTVAPIEQVETLVTGIAADSAEIRRIESAGV